MGRGLQKLELTWFNKDQALIPTEKGKYGYTWVDPKDPRYCETHALVIDQVVRGKQAPKENGVTYSERADFEPTEDNLLIRGESGDVLEVLTRVPELAEKYVGQVKCIYIDPPFNTAQTFANYEDNLEHSIWLTMMRDRLVHLRKLLSADGSIWVHLDDGENHRMRVLLDEVFGAGNYVAEMQWQKTYSPRNDSTGIPMSTDPIIVYRKGVEFSPNKLPRTVAMDSRYKNPDDDPEGPWKSENSTAPGTQINQQVFLYGVQHPLTGEMIYPAKGRTWNINQEWLLEVMRGWGRYELGEVTDVELNARAEVFGAPIAEKYKKVRPLVIPNWGEADAEKAMNVMKSGTSPRYTISTRAGTKFGWKTYLSEKEDSMPTNLLPHTDVGHTDGAKKEIRALFPDLNAFSTPKPERLLERIIHIATDPGDIVLDVFAGSGTTAAVAHKMGRRWVTAELLESTVEKFTLPRLTKVVRGEDPGGITTTTTDERIDDTEEGLPGELSPEDAFSITQAFTKAAKSITAPVDLSKVVGEAVRKDSKTDEPTLDANEAKELRRLMRKLAGAENTETDFLPFVGKAARAQLKTRKSPETINWRGGGGFTVAHLSPACFDYDPALDLVTLTDAAMGRVLIESVAANLNFRLTPEHRYFHGLRGAMRMVVVEGRLGRSKVDDLVAHLASEEGLTIAATEIDDGVRQYLRTLGRGCRAVHIPSDIFTYSAAEEN